MRDRIEAPHPTKTFGLNTPSELLYKLKNDVDRLRQARSSDAARYAAFDCAVTAWHLTDWVLHAIDDDAHLRLTGHKKDAKDGISGFMEKNAERLPCLTYCRQFANSVKHVVITRGKEMPNVSTGSTVKFDPPILINEPDTWPQTKAYAFTYIMVDGEMRPAIEFFENMSAQWCEFLAREGLLSPRHD